MKRLWNFIKSLIVGAYNAFDVRDFFILGGMGMLGYGLYLLRGLSWALIICGPLLMAIGYLMRDK